MKNLFYGFLFAVLIFGSIWFAKYFYSKNNTPQITFQTEKLQKRSIYKKTMATGTIKPRKEVNVKSSVSGIVDKIYVGTGSLVKKGDLLAKVKIIPNTQSLTMAKSSVKKAELNLDNALLDLNRNKSLFEKGIIPKMEYDGYLFNVSVRQQELDEAKQNLEVIRTGSVKNSKEVLSNIRATISGTVLGFGALVGDQITEANTFSEGTTIATVADMGSVYFSGKVDESEVGKLKEGLPIILKIGAIEDKEFEAVLEFIAPKGEDDEGTVKFSVQASIDIPDSVEIRAGYSANAEVLLNQRENVFSISEANVVFTSDSTYVEVETDTQVFEKKLVKTGLSDGLFIEIVSGIDTTYNIKVRNSGM